MATGRARLIVLAAVVVLPIFAGCLGIGAKTNKAPIAAFDASANQINAGDTVHFDATSSTDKDGLIVAFSWTFQDGGTATGKEVDHQFLLAGRYEVDLVVKDNDGQLDRYNATIGVNGWPEPVGVAATNPIKVLEEVTFDGSASRDPDGKLTDYRWSFGDGGTGSGVKPTHTYADVGRYTVNLTVTDDRGARRWKEFTVDVILRRYKVTWDPVSGVLDTINGHTNEKNSTIQQVTIQTTNLTKVAFNLTWRDDIRQFVIGNANDQFVFQVHSPRGDAQEGQDAANETILLTFTIQPSPEERTYEGKTQAEVLQRLLTDVTPSTKGSGLWTTNVTITDAGDLVDTNNQLLDPDRGNNWQFEVVGIRYEARITEVG